MASAAISAGASLLSGIAGGKGASKAAKTQAAAYQKGIDEQARQFNVTQSNLQPGVNAGNSSIQQLLRALGLGDVNTGVSVNGNPALSAQQQQQGYIDGLKTNPLYTSQYQNGVDTIEQNAAATGGLRGGNTQNSLATFGGNLLGTVYQSDLSNLFNLAGIGTGEASSLGSLSQSKANATSGLLGQQGSANATAAAAPYAALQQTLGSLNSGFGLNSGYKW